MPHAYDTIASLPDHIPVFPLDGVLLLPRGHVPLNIFEPRYLDMFEDALGRGRVIGLIQPVDEATGLYNTIERPPRQVKVEEGRLTLLPDAGDAGGEGGLDSGQRRDLLAGETLADDARVFVDPDLGRGREAARAAQR